MKRFTWAKPVVFALFSVIFTNCGPDSESHLNSQQQNQIFQLGNIPPAKVPPGSGSGAYASESASPKARALALSARAALATPIFEQRYGVEAAATLKQYFDNTGRRYVLDIYKLIKESKLAAAHINEQWQEARRFIEMQPDGEYQFVSRQLFSVSLPSSDSQNWSLALGRYHGWTSVHGEISTDPNTRKRTANYMFYYHVWDQYDWDRGETFWIPLLSETLGLNVPLTSDFLGSFHRQGLAKEFESYGIFHRYYESDSLH